MGGDIVRKLKSDKAAKVEVDEAVKKLLALKAEFKTATGSDWKPGASSAPATATSTVPVSGSDLNALNSAIVSQGDIVRKLKADKASKADIDDGVKKLLALKADYKAASGSDWKPGASPMKISPAKESPSTGGGAGEEIAAKIESQGNIVRQLKTDKKPKDEIDAAVKTLLALKAEFKSATGTDWQPAGGSAKKPEKQKKGAKEVKPKEKVEED